MEEIAVLLVKIMIVSGILGTIFIYIGSKIKGKDPFDFLGGLLLAVSKAIKKILLFKKEG